MKKTATEARKEGLFTSSLSQHSVLPGMLKARSSSKQTLSVSKSASKSVNEAVSEASVKLYAEVSQ